MKLLCLLLSVFSLGLFSCQSAAVIPEADAELRSNLFSAVSAMSGRWQGSTDDGPSSITEFTVTSGGSVIREIMMPGEPYEMTNMYSLDGNSLLMTHYCAIGNQPHMRATSASKGRMIFQSEGVSDMKTPDDLYMGEMTLVLIDDNHAEQHWSSFKGGKLDSEMVIKLTRLE